MSVTADVQKHERNPDGFTEYFIVIFYKGVEWGIRKRYSEFVKFDEYLRAQGYKLPCKLPGKNFWSRFDPTLISRRVGELQSYLNHILTSTMNDNNLIREFLEVDEHMLEQAKLLSLNEPEKETAYTDRLDAIVRETRKAVLPISVRLVGTNMHSVANRTTTRQLSSSVFSGRVPSSPGGERSSSVVGGETSVDTQRSNGEPTTSPKDVKEKINYAGGTGSMIQTHIGESKTTSRESPSGSFSETLIVSSNGIVTRKDYLGQRERKDGGSIGTPPSAGPRNLSRSNSVGGGSGGGGGRFSFMGSTSSALDAALAIEDAQRRERFADHVKKLWSHQVSPMGKVLRVRKSKKRLPLPLTQDIENSMGIARLSQLWDGVESKKHVKEQPEQQQQQLVGAIKEKDDDNRLDSPPVATDAQAKVTMHTSASEDTGELQEDLIFRDDNNSWILDILSAPISVEGRLRRMDECVATILSPDGGLIGGISDQEECIVSPYKLWSLGELERRGLAKKELRKSPDDKGLKSPSGGQGKGKDTATAQKANKAIPGSPPQGLRRLKGDKMKPLIRANTMK